ncbi:MAG: response regulator transcription factor [Ornithinimicrobium sp.]
MADTSQAVRVAVINDYEVVVRGVQGLLAAFDQRIQVVELNIDCPVSVPVDVALYDTFAMEGTHGHGLDDIVSNPNVAALAFYTWKLDAELITQARERGVSGVLSKVLSAEHLVACLERIHAGEDVVSPEPSDDARVVPGDWPGRAYRLTPREAEVVSLIAQGLSNQEIAERCYVSINSVKSYIRSAYRTMGVTTRSQAVRWCMLRGIDSSPERIRVAGQRMSSSHGALRGSHPSG